MKESTPKHLGHTDTLLLPQSSAIVSHPTRHDPQPTPPFPDLDDSSRNTHQYSSLTHPLTLTLTSRLLILGTRGADQVVAEGIGTALLALATVAARVPASLAHAAGPAAVELDETTLAGGAARRLDAVARGARVGEVDGRAAQVWTQGGAGGQVRRARVGTSERTEGVGGLEGEGARAGGHVVVVDMVEDAHWDRRVGLYVSGGCSAEGGVE